jgi:predicted acyl esterase
VLFLGVHSGAFGQQPPSAPETTPASTPLYHIVVFKDVVVTEPLNDNRRSAVAINTIYHDAKHASHILLPVIPK